MWFLLPWTWYEKLHFPQGYLYNNLTKMDDHMWFLDFSRQVEIEVEGEKLSLSNPYETVRLGIDPCNGALVLANVFYIPLLDDHEEDMKVLTKEEAMRIAIWYYGKLRAYTDAEIKGLLAHARMRKKILRILPFLLMSAFRPFQVRKPYGSCWSECIEGDKCCRGRRNRCWKYRRDRQYSHCKNKR